MKIHTYKVDNYHNCPIYYRNFGHCFEYLAVINNEIYTAHISVIPTVINRLLYWFKIEKSEYSRQQQEKIIAQLRKMAETTIDFILNEKDNIKDNISEK